jgi:hypothetical protein
VRLQLQQRLPVVKQQKKLVLQELAWLRVAWLRKKVMLRVAL